jgi:hypothetical protein
MQLTGLPGLLSNPPPQLGQTLCKTFFTHSAQKVHSNEQIIASALPFGNGLSQCSQLGLISIITKSKQKFNWIHPQNTHRN